MTRLTNNPYGSFACLDESEKALEFVDVFPDDPADDDGLEYMLDLLRDKEIGVDKFRFEVRSIGYSDVEIDQVLKATRDG